MPPAVTRITPGRGRAGEAVTIEGTGFAAVLSSNSVTVDGIQAHILTASATALAIVVPAGIQVDRHIDVVVTVAGAAATHRWWSKASKATLRTVRLPLHVEGPDEAADAATGTRPEVARSRSFNRASTILEVLPFDLLTSKGRLVARGTNGLVTVAAGATGQRYHRSNGNTGGEWRTREPFSLVWGRCLLAAENTEQQMCANGADTLTTSQGERHAVAKACKLAIITLAVRRASPTANNVSRLRVLVNGTAAFDSDNLAAGDRPSVVQGGVWTGRPWLTLAAGDRVAIAITKSGTTSEMNVIARAVVV